MSTPAPAMQTLALNLPTDKKAVLHVGCGPKGRPERLHESFHTPEWHEVRLDINPDVEPDIVASITDLSIIETGSFDSVWSSHNLEHLFAHQVPLALKEFYRVIKPGGHLLVTLPDLQILGQYLTKGLLDDPINDQPRIAQYKSGRNISPLDILYGLTGAIANGQTFMQHKTGFTGRSLGMKMEAAGFTNVLVRRIDMDLWAEGKKLPA